jgi:hypothetical protein
MDADSFIVVVHEVNPRVNPVCTHKTGLLTLGLYATNSKFQPNCIPPHHTSEPQLKQ